MARKPDKLSKIKYLVILIAVLIAFGTKILALESEVGMRVILTSIGIDKVEDGYEVSSQVFTPQLDETKTQIKSVVSVTAPTIGEAIGSMTLKSGRIATISHCKLIILGKTVQEDDCLSPLNYFMRDSQISWGAVVVATSDKAKKTLEGLNDLEQKASFSWQKFMEVNRENDQTTVMTLRDMMSYSYSESKTALLNIFDIKEQKGDESTGGGTGGGTGGASAAFEDGTAVPVTASGGGGESGQKQVELVTGKKSIVIKSGKSVGEIDENQIRGLHWLDTEVEGSIYSLDQIGDSKITVRMKQKKVKTTYKEVKGKPVVHIKIDASFDQLEALEPHDDSMLETGKTERLQEMTDGIAEDIKKDIRDCFEKSKQIDADVMRFSNGFHAYRPKLFKALGADIWKDVTIEFDVKARLSI